MVLESVLNPVFGPVLLLPPLFAILLMSFIVSLIVTLIYKYTTDQDLMKQLKGELKEFQKQVKELKSEPEKAMSVQKKAMETNMKYMMNSLKPTLFTFVPIILIFGWLNSHFLYESINPGENFNVELMFQEGVQGEVGIVVPNQMEVSGNLARSIEPVVVYSLKGDQPGEYLIDFEVEDNLYTKDVLITDRMDYSDKTKKVDDAILKTIEIDYNKLIVMNLFGWRLGWLGTYIIFSIIFSLTLRKSLKIY